MALDKRTKIFIFIGLIAAIILAVSISPFASQLPDGLEKFAKDKGFLEKGKDSKAWKFSPIPDYAMPGLGNGLMATAVAGLIGTLAVFLIGWGLAYLIRSRPNREEGPSLKDGKREKKLER